MSPLFLLRTLNKKHCFPFLLGLLLSLNLHGQQALTSFQDEITGKFGFKDSSGEIHLEAQFDSVTPFNQGLCRVQKEELWGCIDETGDLIVPLKYRGISIPYLHTVLAYNDSLYFLQCYFTKQETTIRAHKFINKGIRKLLIQSDCKDKELAVRLWEMWMDPHKRSLELWDLACMRDCIAELILQQLYQEYSYLSPMLPATPPDSSTYFLQDSICRFTAPLHVCFQCHQIPEGLSFDFDCDDTENKFFQDRFHVGVYNRWGQLMFESNTMDFNWDGLYQSKYVPDDGFIWVVTLAKSKHYEEERYTGYFYALH